MKNKIQDILSYNLRNYSSEEQQEIIQRLAIIGLRTLQLEQKDPVKIDQIKNVSSEILHEMDDTGHLRKELYNIKEQLSKLSNKFETLSSDKKQERNDGVQNYSSANLSTVTTTTNRKHQSIPPAPLPLPLPHQEKQNLKSSKDNKRQNQFLSSERLHSLPNHLPNHSYEQNCSTSQSRYNSQHKLFESDENSLVRAQNFNKKPSSAWRNGERENSLNKNVNEEFHEKVLNITKNNIKDKDGLRSNSEENSHLDFEYIDIQKKKFMKSNDQVAGKITETKPQNNKGGELIKISGVGISTRHHLDDKHIKDILSEESIVTQNQTANIVPNSDSSNHIRSSLDSSNQPIPHQQRKKWDSNNCQSGESQKEINAFSEQNINSQNNHILEYVSLSQHQQFLPIPLQVNPTQAQAKQLPSNTNHNQINSPQNPNFTSPKFKEGRENSINTQFNTTESKKINTQSQPIVQNPIHSIQNKQSQPQSLPNNISQQEQQYQQQPLQSISQQQKKSNTNNQNQTIAQSKYATTKSLQKRQEINKQKKNQDIKKSLITQNSKKQPNYLKNVTSKIGSEIRLLKETNKGGFNHEVEFVIKEQKQGLVGNKSQTHIIKASQLEAQSQFPHSSKNNPQHRIMYEDSAGYVDDDNNNRYYQDQLEENQLQQISTGIDKYEGYKNKQEDLNYNRELNEDQDESNAYNLHNYNLKRNEHKIRKQISSSNPNQQQSYFINHHDLNDLPPVPHIEESYSDFRNNYSSNSYNQEAWKTTNNNMNNNISNNYNYNYEGIKNEYSNFDQKSSYSHSNLEEGIKSNNFNNNQINNKAKYVLYNNFNDENINHLNIPNQSPHSDKSPSNIGETNSFNYRYNDENSFYSNNNNNKFPYDQSNNNNVNTTSNSQNLLSIANNLLQSPLINQFSNLKQNNKDNNIEQDQYYGKNNKQLYQRNNQYGSKHLNGQQPDFDQFNDSYQNQFSLQQSINDYSYKKTILNNKFGKVNHDTMEQNSQDNYEKQDSSISSSFTSFKPDNNMKEVLQKDGFFQKMFEGDDQQKFDNTFTSQQPLSKNYSNIIGSKSQIKQIADLSHISLSNNKTKEDSIIEAGQFYNNQRYSQISQNMEFNTTKNNQQFDYDYQNDEYNLQQEKQLGNEDNQKEEQDYDDGDDNDNDQNKGIMMNKRLYNFFADQS